MDRDPQEPTPLLSGKTQWCLYSSELFLSSPNIPLESKSNEDEHYLLFEPDHDDWLLGDGPTAWPISQPSVRQRAHKKFGHRLAAVPLCALSHGL